MAKASSKLQVGEGGKERRFTQDLIGRCTDFEGIAQLVWPLNTGAAGNR